MSFQAYLDNIQAKNDKTPEDFRKLAAKKGLVKAGEIIAWLKQDFELGHGHFMAIVHLLAATQSRQAGIQAYFWRLQRQPRGVR